MPEVAWIDGGAPGVVREEIAAEVAIPSMSLQAYQESVPSPLRRALAAFDAARPEVDREQAKRDQEIKDRAEWEQTRHNLGLPVAGKSPGTVIQGFIDFQEPEKTVEAVERELAQQIKASDRLAQENAQLREELTTERIGHARSRRLLSEARDGWSAARRRANEAEAHAGSSYHTRVRQYWE
jgi:hypothetical protein